MAEVEFKSTAGPNLYVCREYIPLSLFVCSHLKIKPIVQTMSRIAYWQCLPQKKTQKKTMILAEPLDTDRVGCARCVKWYYCICFQWVEIVIHAHILTGCRFRSYDRRNFWPKVDGCWAPGQGSVLHLAVPSLHGRGAEMCNLSGHLQTEIRGQPMRIYLSINPSI